MKTVTGQQPMKINRKKPLSPEAKKKRMLLIGLGGGVALGLGYIAYNYFKNKAATQRSIQTPVTKLIPSDSIPIPSLPVATSHNFPVKKGARGSLVQMIQNALIQKGGQAAMIIRETSFRNGQVDGIFGSGTERALQAAGFPSALTQSNFTTLVGKQTNTSSSGANGIAKEIIDGANTRNLFSVLNGLKKIKSVNDYKQVSSFFQNIRILGTRVTSLVNALLSVAFVSKELEKVKIRAEFTRMGLKQSARGIWSIPNLGGITDPFDSYDDQVQEQWNLAIIEKPTLLKSGDGSYIVPELLPNTVVGYITGIQNGITKILTQSGETVYAPTKNLSSL